MRHHVKRVVERRDGGNGLHRFSFCENFPALAMWRQIAGKNLPVILNRKLAGEGEDVVRTPCLIKGMLLADAKLKRQPVSNFLAALADQLGGAMQNLLALVTGQLWL